MVNEISWAMDWIDTGEGVRKDTNKVTEQDIKRVQWDSAKAKKVQDEIKKNKWKNNNIAQFLSFLLKNIKNDDLINSTYETFFKVIDTRTKTSYLRKSTNNIMIVWFFAPFYPKEIESYKLSWFFDDIIGDLYNKLSFSEYISYIKKLSKQYHDKIPINQDNLLKFLALLMGEFWIIKDPLNEANIEKIKKELIKK